MTTSSQNRSVKLEVVSEPCSTCPYRRDTPRGIWHGTEYEKLPPFDTNDALSTFLCHQTSATGIETVCRGWLTVHRESVAVRLAMDRGAVTPDEVYADVKAELYATGAEACEAGLSAVDNPGEDAIRQVKRLKRNGVGRA